MREHWLRKWPHQRLMLTPRHDEEPLKAEAKDALSLKFASTTQTPRPSSSWRIGDVGKPARFNDEIVPKSSFLSRSAARISLPTFPDPPITMMFFKADICFPWNLGLAEGPAKTTPLYGPAAASFRPIFYVLGVNSALSSGGFIIRSLWRQPRRSACRQPQIAK